MKTLSEIKATNGVIVLEEGADGCCGWIYHRHGKRIFFIASWGMGWEYVSVSHMNKNPSWDEMYLAKSIFWNANEYVVQYYPNVNNSPYCLTMWRPVGTDIPVPPKILV
ncbi:MAG: hypothetical protein NC177_07635 [Ruminococcus flavefaciens]|nr:hypothetical protein [Ruminococcus flavefaciens]